MITSNIEPFATCNSPHPSSTSSLQGPLFKEFAGIGAPAIEQAYSIISCWGPALRNCKLHTHQSMFLALISKFNLNKNMTAVPRALKQFLLALDRSAKARSSYNALQAAWPKSLGVPLPTDEDVDDRTRNLVRDAISIGGSKNKRRATNGSARKVWDIVSRWIASFEFFMEPFKETQMSTRGASAETRSGSSKNEGVVTFFRDHPVPSSLKASKGGGVPKVFSINEAWDLLSKYQQLRKTLLRITAQEIRGAQENALECVGRLVRELRELLTKYHMHQAAGKEAFRRNDVAACHYQMATAKKSAEKVLKELATHSKDCREDDLKNFCWPNFKQLSEADRLSDVLPARYMAGGGADPLDRELAKLINSRANMRRRHEDVLSARNAIESLAPNVAEAVSSLASFVSSANALLAADSVTEDKVEAIIRCSAAPLDGPFSVPRPLSADGKVSRNVVTYIVSLISRSCAFINRLTEMTTEAQRIQEAVRFIRDDATPALDQRQIYASRFGKQLRTGSLSPEDYSKLVSAVGGVAQSRHDDNGTGPDMGEGASDIESGDDSDDDHFDEAFAHDDSDNDAEIIEIESEHEAEGNDEASNSAPAAASDYAGNDDSHGGDDGDEDGAARVANNESHRVPGEAANAADRGEVEPIGGPGQAADAADSGDNQAAHAANRKRRKLSERDI